MNLERGPQKPALRLSISPFVYPATPTRHGENCIPPFLSSRARGPERLNCWTLPHLPLPRQLLFVSREAVPRAAAPCDTHNLSPRLRHLALTRPGPDSSSNPRSQLADPTEHDLSSPSAPHSRRSLSFASATSISVQSISAPQHRRVSFPPTKSKRSRDHRSSSPLTHKSQYRVHLPKAPYRGNKWTVIIKRRAVHLPYKFFRTVV